jgi:hypothetical protein
MIAKMGKKPARYDARTLRLENYLAPVVQLPPLESTVDWNKKISHWTIMGNDDYKDCVAAGAGHVIQTWSANAGREVIIPDQDVLDLYFKLTGGADDGLDMLNFLKTWRKTPGGFWGHPIGAFVAFDPQNLNSWRYVVQLGGVVYAGFSMPKTALTQWEATPRPPWTVVDPSLSGDSAPGSGDGHCMVAGHFADFGSNLTTWGDIQPATNEWIGTYCDEAYWLVGVDWFDPRHVTPSGLHWSELVADLNAAIKS